VKIYHDNLIAKKTKNFSQEFKNISEITEKNIMYTKKISILLTLLSFLCIPAQAKTKWILKETDSGYSLWKDLYSGTRVTKNNEKNIKGVKFNKAYYQKLEIKKKKQLEFIEVTDWKVENYQVKKNQITFYGTYTDREKRTIYFQEIHLIYKSEMIQFLYTAYQKIKNPQKNKNEILKEFL